MLFSPSRRLVHDDARSKEGWIELEPLPPDEPELDPVEAIWTYSKQRGPVNVCPKDSWQSSETARRTLGRMRHCPRLITAFWKPASLRPGRRFITRKQAAA